MNARWTCRGTPWCPLPCPPWSSAWEWGRPQVWHINQDAIFDRHSMVMVSGLWDSNWNFFACQDALEVRTSSTTPGDERKNIPTPWPLVLIFIHIVTYLEEELAWRHWERLLRAITTWAIFTVSLYKKVLIKTSPRCVPLVTQGTQLSQETPIIPRINHSKFQPRPPLFILSIKMLF